MQTLSYMFINNVYRKTKCDATEECLSSQWKKNEPCIFTEALRYFGIKDKNYQDKI